MKKSIISFLIATALCIPLAMQAKVEHLLPKPQRVEIGHGNKFSLNRTITITDQTDCALLRKFFTDCGCTIVSTGGVPVNVGLVSSITDAYDYTLYGYDNEAYTLDITADAINITATTNTGVIRAAQTLVQLAEGYDGTAELEAVSITDWPAFKLRGFMHDVGRSFIEFETLKKHIELLSRFKINTFHWHMTENQAWRFQVKAYPQLTEAQHMTRFPGKYYTQEQCTELQNFAKERGVIVIPEIDMPGHSEAFYRAMGHDMQTTQGVEELKTILEEVAATFPDAPYIHIGADEKTITYTNFLKIMTDKVHSLGKKVVVWNPISGVTITTSTGADMTQMWSTNGKVITGMPNIDCRYNYTNHFDVYADLVGIFKSNIYYEQRGNSNVAGTISAPWNDRKTATEEDIIKQNNFYANMVAIAERAWIGGGKRYIDNCNNGGTNGGGGTTLPNSGEEYDEFADWEERFLFHKANSLNGEPIPYVKQTNVRWRITEPFPNNGNMNAVFAPEPDGLSATAEMQNSYTYNGTTYDTNLATGAGIYLRHTWGNNTIQTHYGNVNYSNSTAYAWTYVYSESDRTVGAQIEFQNYSRSEKDKAPDAGNWDRKGSNIWINGQRIDPPVWENTGISITDNEQLLKNENFTARPPVQLRLNAGWNKVFIKLPYVTADGVRLNKWMFTFVLTDVEGKNAIEDLIYSPSKSFSFESEEAEDALALISEAKELLKHTGVGYPASAPRATLETAINEAEADPVSADCNALQSAIDTYIATTDVELPTDGKKYTISMVAKNGNRFYLNYTGSDIALVSRTDEPLPESAHFRCQDNGNGTVTLITTDGKYLVYHSKYAGVDWLRNRGDTDGFQNTEDDMTKITFAKMQNGAYVEATNNRDIFGLLTWYSLRGYDTGKYENCYGYVVIKTDGSDYDGASAPFWNANYSSALLVELVEETSAIEDITTDCIEPTKGIYNLQGIKLESADKPGFYIVDGKKVFLK